MTRKLEHATVVGSSGFLGSWLVDTLVKQGVFVTGVSRQNPPKDVDLASPDCLIQADVNEDDPAHFIPECDAVFFLAGVASVPRSVINPLADLDSNLRTPVRILAELAKRNGSTSVIHASSAAVYGNATDVPMNESHRLSPISPYGVSKLCTETYLRLFASEFNVPTASARIFSVYGPGQKKLVVYDWAKRLATETSPVVFAGAGEITRDLLFVSDAASALVHIAKNAPLRGEAFNVGSGQETSLNALAGKLCKIAKKQIEYTFTGKVRTGDPVRWCADITALQNLGFLPQTSLDTGLQTTFSWANSVDGI